MGSCRACGWTLHKWTPDFSTTPVVTLYYCLAGCRAIYRQVGDGELVEIWSKTAKKEQSDGR